MNDSNSQDPSNLQTLLQNIIKNPENNTENNSSVNNSTQNASDRGGLNSGDNLASADLMDQDPKGAKVERQNLTIDSDIDFGQENKSSSEDSNTSPRKKRKEREEKSNTITGHSLRKISPRVRRRRNSDPGKHKPAPWIPAGSYEPPLTVYPLEPTFPSETPKLTEKRPTISVIPWIPPGVPGFSHSAIVQSHAPPPLATKKIKTLF